MVLKIKKKVGISLTPWIKAICSNNNHTPVGLHHWVKVTPRYNPFPILTKAELNELFKSNNTLCVIVDTSIFIHPESLPAFLSLSGTKVLNKLISKESTT